MMRFIKIKDDAKVGIEAWSEVRESKWVEEKEERWKY